MADGIGPQTVTTREYWAFFKDQLIYDANTDSYFAPRVNCFPFEGLVGTTATTLAPIESSKPQDYAMLTGLSGLYRSCALEGCFVDLTPPMPCCVSTGGE